MAFTQELESKEDAGRWGLLWKAALAAGVVHSMAALAMLFILGNGLETNPDLHSRCQYIVDHQLLWSAGWLCWNASAGSILFFFLAFTRAHAGSNAVILKLVLSVATVAVAIDLTSEAIEMGLIPQLAQQTLSSGVSNEFLNFHRVVVILSGFSANLLYTLATLLSVLGTRASYAGWVKLVGFAVVTCGVAISTTCVIENVTGMFWSNAFLVPLLVLWQLGIALDAHKRATAQAPTIVEASDRKP